ncbi:PadR family transcriptional regulator [Natronosalvus rutilus]|uniref:PadR family transcriptional regulator n=1 Tax=Natronosalvus rutilus TaxID=2953753 RepID=A0A9E7NF55_9EURY|nr:helix-turn-helix transcriptional regulator [Natronosalvus rutilus]UTF55864.1 PadR family transcriptional regulator [Natronosalvus rutilus]
MADSNPTDEEGASGRNPPSTGPIEFSTYNIPTDLTAFQTHLLCLIHRFGPVEGVTLQNALEDLYPEDINHGRLYPSLDRMVDSGLITKQTKEKDKRRKEYALTGRGEWVAEEYHQFVREMIAPPAE